LNLAAARAQGEFLLFTDDDVRFPADWIAEMCTPLIRGEGVLVVGGARLAPDLQRDWMTKYHRGLLASTEYLSPTDPSEFAGINMACLRRVFLEAAEFDNEMGPGARGKAQVPQGTAASGVDGKINRYDVIAGEDSFFGRRLKKAGYAFVPRTHVLVEHHPDKARLLYKSWIRATLPQGRFQAYVLHHWEHGTIRFVRIRLLYFRLKLFLRLLINPRYMPDDEGMPPWELSYRIEVSRLEHYLRERDRPRNYPRFGLRKHPQTTSHSAPPAN
jgi:GT2 family glycosyltransferase